MPKYLVTASYTAEGTKGVLKDGGTKRRQAAEAAFQSVGGRVESFYFAFGEYDLYSVVEVPDHAAMAAAAMTIGASGALRVRTVVLITPEELDQASKKSPTYQPPGR